MNNHFKSIILQKTGASSLQEKEVIQSLWSGYGKIIRVTLEGSPLKSVVVKNVQLPKQLNHPRGWNSDIGHQRKLKSYQVESYWYKNYSNQSKARLPKCLAITKKEGEVLIVLEDLDESGFLLRKQNVSWLEIEACLQWLANFHASFLGKDPIGLWEVGTYWHLATRPQELKVLEDIELKKAAAAIDNALSNCQHKTFVHGDAKLANFCFSKNGQVAGVDFQYVGGGCGMKDVAYFVGSCLNENDCERLESKILDTYFSHLHNAIGYKNEALEKEWRALYYVAWADFHRFLKGWSPGHWKINSYSERITKQVIKNL
ncbi:choline kinase [Polaribacter reichenbachii]|uniref:Choline kinase n=1 Tax=Polaribacter reichenbachii TaxID=996801 RepID=A0A1B8U6W6_9FLAO|nr:oxidoreductase family protein [Polaribacter reichenbachii]APZ46253.1 choline kinase [Polaribacter reichenbachii]AUC20116.1 choline kinase [Polaribacter reichenbachii]OBY67625.1 choline kinase [Polaribacter reichenbachii]